MKKTDIKLKSSKGELKHPKCQGYKIFSVNGDDYDCGYDTLITCEECKYGLGRKDPEAKCNV